MWNWANLVTAPACYASGPARYALGFTYRKLPTSFKTTSNLLSFTSRPQIINVFCLLKKNEHGKCVKCHQVWSMKFIYIMFKNFKLQVKLGFWVRCPRSSFSLPHFPTFPLSLPLSLSHNFPNKNIKSLKTLPLSLKFNKISLNPTSYQTPTNYDYVMMYVS